MSTSLEDILSPHQRYQYVTSLFLNPVYMGEQRRYLAAYRDLALHSSTAEERELNRIKMLTLEEWQSGLESLAVQLREETRAGNALETNKSSE